MNPEAIKRFAGVVREFAESAQAAAPGRVLKVAYPTRAELEVAYMVVVDGLSAKQIAERLARSPKTVELHLSHFRQKCGLKGLRYGWLPVNAAYWRAVGRDEARAEAVAS